MDVLLEPPGAVGNVMPVLRVEDVGVVTLCIEGPAMEAADEAAPVLATHRMHVLDARF